jgi:hypothetical protein
VLTTSDLLVGEDGNEDFLASDVPYDTVGVHLNQTPLRTVTMGAGRPVTARLLMRAHQASRPVHN